MPRTKKPARKDKSIEEGGAIKKLEKLGLDAKKKIDCRAQLMINNLDISFKILLGSIKTNYLQMTVGQLKNELYLQEAPSIRVTGVSSCSASNDDGYLTENSSQGSGDRPTTKKHLGIPVPTSRPRRSRSADASVRKPSAPSTTIKLSQRRRSRSVYKTPAYNKNAMVNYPVITPKVTPQTPLTVLRQPRQGEMVVSMSGSPVMVPTCYTMKSDEMANCNILLQDGTMLSLQPKQLRKSQAYIPFSLMNNNVLDQLRTLKDNLDTVVQLGEKVIK